MGDGMKITLSKSQWTAVGKKAGWMKTSQKSMSDRMDAFFSPAITLKRNTINGRVIPGRWYVDLVRQRPLAKQFINEAGIQSDFGTIADSDLDAFSDAAGKHGYSVETIGE